MKEPVQKSVAKFLKELISECSDKHILTLASSSSFFLILTFVPFFLLMARLVGVLFGDGVSNFDLIMSKLELFLPENIVGVVDPIKVLLKKSLFAKTHFTLLNFAFLAVASLGFINSIWRSLVILTGDKQGNQLTRVLKGVGVIGISFSFVSLSFLFPLLLSGLKYILDLRVVTNTLLYLKLDQLLHIGADFTSSLSFISFFVVLIFTTVLFRYLLNRYINSKSAFVGAVLFSTVFSFSKSLFFIYASLAKTSLSGSYGTSYGLILLLIWLLFTMSLFYFSIVFSVAYHRFTHRYK